MRRRMLRSVTGRLGMACYALWLALALVTQDVTPCPTHDGPGAMAVAMAMMPSMQMDGATQGVMTDAAHGASEHTSRDASHGSSHGAHHACTCVGCGCCVAALDALAPAATLVPAPAIVARGTTRPVAAARVEPTRVDRRLPFANAPPRMMNSAV